MPGAQPEAIQRRQANLLKHWHRYLIGNYASHCSDAIEVGCGAGFVMENLRDQLGVYGIDIDRNQVKMARSRDLNVDMMDGLSMEIEDDSFDLAYCSYYLMWLKDPKQAISEMARVARKRVLFTSEPIWGGALFLPAEMEVIVKGWIDLIGEKGGNPDGGLEAVKALTGMGQPCRFGTVPKDTSPRDVVGNVRSELEYLRGEGIDTEVSDPIFFDVPFVWGVLFLDGQEESTSMQR